LPGRQAQRVGRDLELVGAASVDDGLQARLLLGELVEVGVGLRVRRVHFIEALLGRGRFAQRFFDAFAHRLPGLELRLLLQKAHPDARHADHLAVVVFIRACHDLQQARLARAVQPEHADLGAREEIQRDVLEDGALGRDDFADPAHRVDVLGHGFLNPVAAMIRKTALATALVGLVSNAGLVSSAHALDGVSFEVGQGEDDTDLWRVGLQWSWKRRWFAERSWTLGAYWDLQLGRWSGPLK